MGKNKKKVLISNLEILLIHLLKYKFQSEKRTKSWLLTIEEHKRRINKAFKNTPSLKNYLKNIFENTINQQELKLLKKLDYPLIFFRFNALLQ